LLDYALDEKKKASILKKLIFTLLNKISPMFQRVLFIVFIFMSAPAFSQQADFKLYLVGDAGENEMTGETLDSLKSKILHNPRSALIFMGDNCYKNTLFGLVEGFKGFDSSIVTQKKILSQLDILTGYRGSIFFVPGNHDWWNIIKFEKAKRKLKMEESFIEDNLLKNPTIANPDQVFLPKDGSPGPATVELNNKKVRIIFIDTYWLILLGFKNNPQQNLIYANTFYHNLDSVLALGTKQHQRIIVVAHHPVYFTDTLVAKGLIIAKKLKHPYLFGRIKQSISSFPSYDTMSRKINDVLSKYPGVFYASGHIHALQFHTVNGVNYIISGSGSKTTPVKEKNTGKASCENGDCEIWNEKGFFEMDFYRNFSPRVILYHHNGEESTTVKPPEGLQ
jgi:hypothetical protein